MIFCKLGDSLEEKKQWDDYIFAAPWGHLFQSYDWGEVSRTLGWEPLRFIVKKDSSIDAAVQVLKRQKGPFSILYAPRGPVFNDHQSFDFLMNNIKTVIQDNNSVFLKINPAIKKPTEIEKWCKDLNFIRSEIAAEMHICTYLINLNKDLEAIWSDFAPMVKKSINKAQRKNVVIEQVIDLEGLVDFYRMYEETFIKKNVNYQSFSFIKDVWQVFQGRGVEVFLAKHNGNPIAGLLILLYGNTCEELWTGAKGEYLELRPHQLLHWHIFCWLKERCFKTYNMGGVPLDKQELPGIQFYKKSFGGNFVEFLGEHDFVNRPLLYSIWKKLTKIRNPRRR